MMARNAEILRKTAETEIKVRLNLDGTGQSRINTPAGFFNHMLTLFSRHSLFDLEVEAVGDVEVDYHHLVEDTGIVFGEAFLKALGEKKFIRRYGNFYAPMDESLGFSAVDISGRPYIFFRADCLNGRVGKFDAELVEEFFRAFANSAKITMHIEVVRGKNKHHIIESVFKASARALREAVSLDEREKGIPSSKGIL